MQHHRVAAAVHDRDSDIPVVFYGLCLSRSHHLFGLIERDRSAIVTDTFVNRHHSLPFVGAAQHAINVSGPLGQSDFAERMLRNISLTVPDHCSLIPANLTTLAHFSVSAAMNFPSSSGAIGISTTPTSASRDFAFASASTALISLLSLSMISTGVFFGAATPNHPLAS